jgi:hypothetical protein
MLSQRAGACLAGLAAAVVMAGPYDSPYALVEAGDPNAARNEFAPAITRVDGESTRDPRRTDPIAPGKHRVTVRFETARVTQSPQEVSREVELDLAACTRYRIVARRTEGTNWEPHVYQEPIGECAKKFGKSK